MSEFYGRIAAVNFDSSVYDTNDISTIRGASLMLLHAFKGINKDYKKYEIEKVLQWNGSELICRLKADSVEDAENKLNGIIPDGLKPFSTFTHAAVETSGSFSGQMALLRTKCNWQQQQSLSFVMSKKSDQAVRECELNGVLPADVLDPKKGDFAIATLNRRERGRELRQELYNEILPNGSAEHVALEEESDEPIKFSRHLEELASNPPKGKLAFIYLDGNKFGRLRQNAEERGEAELVMFNDDVQKKLRNEALKKVLEYVKKHCLTKDERNKEKDVTKGGKFAFETLLWGGDEALFVVPAWHALEILKKFYQTIQGADKSKFALPDENYTHAAGVIFCHYKLPVLQVRQYAEELCELAKKRLTADKKTTDSIAFLNMNAFDLVKGDVVSFIENYHKPAQPQDFIIDAGQLGQLQKDLTKLAGKLSRSKQHQLATAATQGNEPFNAILEKLKKMDKQDEKILSWIEEQFGQNSQKFLVYADLLDFAGGAAQ